MDNSYCLSPPPIRVRHNDRLRTRILGRSADQAVGQSPNNCTCRGRAMHWESRGASDVAIALATALTSSSKVLIPFRHIGGVDNQAAGRCGRCARDSTRSHFCSSPNQDPVPLAPCPGTLPSTAITPPSRYQPSHLTTVRSPTPACSAVTRTPRPDLTSHSACSRFRPVSLVQILSRLGPSHRLDHPAHTPPARRIGTTPG